MGERARFANQDQLGAVIARGVGRVRRGFPRNVLPLLPVRGVHMAVGVVVARVGDTSGREEMRRRAAVPVPQVRLEGQVRGNPHDAQERSEYEEAQDPSFSCSPGLHDLVPREAAA